MSNTPELSKIASGLPPSGIRKFFDLANEMKGEVISLSIGEPDFVTPWHIREKGIESIEKGKTHYSPNQGYKKLRDSVSDYVKRKFAMEYDPEDEIIATVGGSEAIDIAVRALVDPGDEVIIPEPCFVAYKACVTLSGGIPVILNCTAKDEFKPKAEDISGLITSKTKMIILGYPTNPTGTTLTKEDLIPIAELCVRHNLTVISDELYAELTYSKEPHYSISRLPGMKNRTIVINGLSKAFAMTGWRIGFTLGPKKFISAMNRIHQYVIMSSPSMAQYAAIEALDNGDTSVEMMKKEYNTRKRVIIDRLKNMGMDCHVPGGAFYVFPSIKFSKLSSEIFCERFLMEKKVAIVPGNAFGDCGEGYVRISYAASMENIKEAMDRLEEFIVQFNVN